MTAREILAYAITHAPKGVKGGPYDSVGGKCRDLAMALKWTKRGARARLGDVLGGRVIRIVRKARPSEPMSRMPDPMPVVRAAMRYLDHGDDGRLGSAWVGFREAVDAYRKAGGTP